MRTHLSRLLVAASIIGLLPSSAAALSCLPSTPKDEFGMADAVFSGTVQSINEEEEEDGWMRTTVTVNVDTVFKGIVSSSQQVTTDTTWGPFFTMNTKYLVYAYEPEVPENGLLNTSPCGHTSEYALADKSHLPGVSSASSFSRASSSRPRVSMFTDVSASAWYATYVEQAAAARIVSGYSDAQGNPLGLFKPGNNVTLAEALKMAVEAADYDVNAYPETGIALDHWVVPYYKVAINEGFDIFIGANEQVNAAATRAQVARIITDAFLPDEDVVGGRTDIPNPYTDVRETGDYWYQPILRLTQDGILSGDGDAQGNLTGKFRPMDPINRAEVAKIVMAARVTYGMPGAERKASTMVNYNGNSGFSPSTVTIHVGENVRFYNAGSTNMRVASDPHPTHTNFPDFDSQQALGPGAAYIFTFLSPGSWSFHNHLNPSHTGTVVVEE